MTLEECVVLRLVTANNEIKQAELVKQTGHFTEIMFIRDTADLLEFKKRYGLENVPKEY